MNPMPTYVIQPQNFSKEGVLTLRAQDQLPLCPVCHAPVLIAANAEEAKQVGIPPGMQCSKNFRHFEVEFLARLE